MFCLFDGTLYFELSDDVKQKDIFYCKPKLKFAQDDPCWFFDLPVGHNILSRKLADMFKSAGLECDGSS